MKKSSGTGELLRWLAVRARETAAGRYRLKIPKPIGILKRGGGQHFHGMPELFIQTGGCTDFDCPAERFTLAAGGIAVMPIGVPHRETARPWRGPFQNFVVQPTPDSQSWHEGAAGRDGVPFPLAKTVIRTPEAARLVRYLNDLVDIYHGAGSGREGAVRGLLLVTLSFLRNLLEGSIPARGRYSPKVAQAQHFVFDRLFDSDLNVRRVAAGLHCSADYLSNLFRRETGHTLTAFIRRQRVTHARSLLETSAMSVKEIALAVGYRDSGYFIRVFKRITGQTPAAYRSTGSIFHGVTKV